MFTNLNERYPNLKGKIRITVRPMSNSNGYVPLIEGHPVAQGLEGLYYHLQHDKETVRALRCSN